MTPTLSTAASTGFHDASSYDKYRPSYSAEVVEAFLTRLGLTGVTGARIVEIGAGTGKFTEILAVRPERYEIVAVEPQADMREGLVNKDLKGVKVKDGVASNISIADAWGDACIAAQAFHWFATDETLKEVNRVLRPGATFGMIWNIEDYNSPQAWPCTTRWETTMNDIIWSLDDSAPRFRHQKWKEVFDNQLDTTPLETLKDTFTNNLPKFSLPLGEDSIPWTVWIANADAIWKRYSTLSHIANLDVEGREKVRKQVLEALQGDDVERNEKGEIALHGCTFFAWTSRI